MKGLKMRASAFVTKPKPAVISKPTERPFDYVSEGAQSTTVFRVAFSQARHQWGNSSRGTSLQVGWRPVSVVALENVGMGSRPSFVTRAWWDAVQHFHRGLGIMDVSRGGVHHQGQPLCLNDYMAFAALFPSVRRVGTCVVPPKTARTDWLSMIARDRSICPALPKTRSKRRCTSGQTPALVQSLSLRQQLTPLPQPSSLGSRRQAAPVRRMYAIPVSALRAGISGRPPFGFGLSAGSKGLISFHSSSGTSANAIVVSPVRSP